MKRLFVAITAIMTSISLWADNYTVTVVYKDNKATITIPEEVASYVSVTSGSSSHVKLVQTSTNEDNPGEIIYQLSGSSADGEFYMTGEYKATLQLNGLTLTNPDSTAIHIKDGKRIKVSMMSGTTSTLADGVIDTESKGCFHSKGHTEFVGRGTLNIASNIRHAIFSKEYVEIKNCTINITGAKKDGIHCQQYFKMTSGTVNISGVEDDGIQVELKGEEPFAGSDTEDEDTGNFYMTEGTLAISNYGASAIKAAGSVTFTGGIQDFPLTDVMENATGIKVIDTDKEEPDFDHADSIYDLNGRQLPAGSQPQKGVYILRKGKQAKKIQFLGK